MMFSISPAARAGRAGHRAGLDRRDRGVIAKRSQEHVHRAVARTGAAQRPHRGDVLRPRAGQGVRPPGARSRQTFAEKNEELYEASFGAQFVCGLIMPAMMFIGNLNYVVDRGARRAQVATGSMSLGDVQAFIQYSRQFTQPLTQVASMANLLQSGRGLRRAGLRAARRAGAGRRTPRRRRPPEGERRGEVALRARVVLATARQAADRGPRRWSPRPGQTVAIVGPTGAGKTTLVNLMMRFYDVDGGRITLDGVDIADDAARRPARRRSAWCCRTPGCSAARSARTSPTAGPDATEERDPRGRAGRPTSTASCTRCPTATTPCIDEEGSNVCAGEKQLITIARAFLSDPALLILDEATSSVDTRTEVLRAARDGRAAHRPDVAS